MEVTAPPGAGDVASLPEKEADEPSEEDGVVVQVRTLLLFDQMLSCLFSRCRSCALPAWAAPSPVVACLLQAWCSISVCSNTGLSRPLVLRSISAGSCMVSAW